MVAQLAVGPPVTAVSLADVDTVAPAASADIDSVSTVLSVALTEEFDGARRHLGVSVEELLLAALGGAVAKATGGGTLLVGCTGTAREPRTVNLDCVDHHGLAANETLIAVRRALATSTAGVAGTDVRFRCDGPSAGEPVLLDLEVIRDASTLQLCWRFDRTRLLAGTVADLADQYRLALIELTSEAVAPIIA